MTVRIALADDQALIREGFRAILERSDDLVVVGEASNGLDAVSLTRRLKPDVVVMDVRMPGLDGIQATARITADPDLSATRVLVVTTFEIDDYVFAALRAGASGFLLKDLEADELRRAVRIVADGNSLLAPSVTRRLVEEFAARPTRDSAILDRLSELTVREKEIVVLVGRGLSNDEIAGRLQISATTAKTHVSRAMLKLGARDRAQLVVFAYDAGLVTPAGP